MDNKDYIRVTADTTVTADNAQYQIKILDSTHLKIRFKDTDTWLTYHIHEIKSTEIFDQLKEQGYYNGLIFLIPHTGE